MREAYGLNFPAQNLVSRPEFRFENHSSFLDLSLLYFSFCCVGEILDEVVNHGALYFWDAPGPREPDFSSFSDPSLLYFLLPCWRDSTKW
jgi:hypothetical protein